jgi:hypothetical protein
MLGLPTYFLRKQICLTAHFVAKSLTENLCAHFRQKTVRFSQQIKEIQKFKPDMSFRCSEQ